jgi:phosphohistidine swiveling domain-containing protein
MESNLPTINSVEFWARETILPLFWLTDSEHFLGDLTLFFYKNGMLHFYYLNGSEKNEEKSGFNYFSKEENVRLYEKESEEAIKNAEKVFNEYNKLNFEKLNMEELAELFDFFRKKLNNFSELYLKTEDARTRTLKEKDADLNKIATLRWKLRKSLPNLLDIIMVKFLNEVARRNNLSATNDLFFYNLNEMIHLLKTGSGVHEDILKDRRSHFAFLREGERSRIFSKTDTDILWKMVNEILLPKDKNEIKGSPVYGGIVRGRAKVIFQSDDTKINQNGYGVGKGDIIVTDMTKPGMMIACKNATGIITDEGGIVCHASIIAREFKKPCIVGTKIGTQVINDGDLLELDADKGIVKILNNK